MAVDARLLTEVNRAIITLDNPLFFLSPGQVNHHP